MRLLLDIGNSRIKWAYLADGAFCESGSFAHRGQSLDAVCDSLQRLPGEPEAVFAVNVAGDVAVTAVAECLNKKWGVSLEQIEPAKKWGEVSNGYTDHTQLGADRWAAIVGAWQQYRADLCVVDAGTAVTIDIVRADGRHLGGIILAGRQLAQTALLGETADIANFAQGPSGPGDRDWFGRSTAEAISRGAEFGLGAAIDRAVSAFPGSTDPSGAPQSAVPTVVLTGGDADILAPLLNCDCRLHPQLVLEGLAILAGGR